MKLFYTCLAVGAAGSAGAIARLLITSLFQHLLGSRFPVGTFLINVTGCFILGWFWTYVDRHRILSPTSRLAVTTGFVGAYTTFSTYIYDSDAMFHHGAMLKGCVNLFGSVIVGLLAVRLGIAAAQLGGPSSAKADILRGQPSGFDAAASTPAAHATDAETSADAK
jgi:CrcB protein